jgi:hypothetical protein
MGGMGKKRGESLLIAPKARKSGSPLFSALSKPYLGWLMLFSEQVVYCFYRVEGN